VDRAEEDRALALLKGEVALEKKVRIRRERGFLKEIEEIVELGS